MVQAGASKVGRRIDAICRMSHAIAAYAAATL
jgi:hypothetical protein